MHLWTEYEGRTIAGSYTLGKLLRSEGRNGFFATSTGTGDSAVIRLTESHFDEEEVLKRWRQVADLHQENLIDIERTGKTTFDGVPLTYALMERNDADLEEVLKERPLTTAETTQVARSVLAALTALHAGGLVHEHIEPINVLAVGEVVKLRSDCVRECIADGEFTSAEACEELRRKDVRDFGVLLLRCLTLERELTPAHRLPDPFQRIVPGAIEGTFSVAQIDTVLNPAPRASLSPAASGTTGNGITAVAAVNGAVTRSAESSSSAMTPRAEPAMRVRSRQPVEALEPEGSPLRKIVLIAAAALLVLLLGWRLLGHKSAATVATHPAPVIAPGLASSAPARAAAPMASGVVNPVSHAAAGWYVIAYTYNHEDQARAKAIRVAARHGGFRPEVFSPTGHAPFFVSLDGPMNEGEAEAVLRRARRSGMPRDTFMRRY